MPLLPLQRTRQPQSTLRVDRSNPLTRGITFLKSVPGSASAPTVGAASLTAPLGMETRPAGISTRFTGYGGGTVDTTGVGQNAKGTVLVMHQSTLLPPNGGFPNPGYSHVLAATSSGTTSGNGWLLMLGNGNGYLQFRIFNVDDGNAVGVADGATALNDGKPHVTVATWDAASGGILNTYVDGVQHATSSGLTAAVTIAQPMRLGRSRETNEFWGKFDGNMFLAAAWDRILTAAEVRQVSANPWQIFAAEPEFYFDAPTGGATDTPVNPDVGTLALTGYAPTIAQTANQSVVPGVGSLVITGYAPTVSQSVNQAIAADAGSLALTGYAPSIAQTGHQAVAPPAGSLTITGYAPTVTQEAASPDLAPGVGTLTITGYAPTVTQSSSQASGGYFPSYPSNRRRTTVQEDRERLGILPKRVRKVIAEVAQKSIVQDKTDAQAVGLLRVALPEQDMPQIDLYAELLREMREQVKADDPRKAIAERRRQRELEEDEREAEMLLM